MLRCLLSIAFGLLLTAAVPARAETVVPSAERLARLADERGPIRRHLDEAFPRSGAVLAAPADAAAPSPPPPAKTRRPTVPQILIGLVVVYAAFYLIGFRNGFDL